MATVALPFDVVEQHLTHVDSGVSVGESLNNMVRALQRSLLTFAFYHTAKVQAELIVALQRANVNSMSDEQMTDIASKLDRVNEKTQLLILHGKQAQFDLWGHPLARMSKNLEKLDNLAESYHMSASPRFVDYIGALVDSAATSKGATEESWRDFVATLHD